MEQRSSTGPNDYSNVEAGDGGSPVAVSSQQSPLVPDKYHFDRVRGAAATQHGPRARGNRYTGRRSCGYGSCKSTAQDTPLRTSSGRVTVDGLGLPGRGNSIAQMNECPASG